MLRSFFLFLFLFLVLALTAAGASSAKPMLQPNVTITGDTIHLGDLFSDAGAHAGDPVAAAPALGLYMTFNANWLGAVAREHHLDWTPSSFDQASVKRASRVIGADAVAQRILAEAAPNAGPSDGGIQLDNPGLRFVVPAEASDSIALDGLNVDQRSGRFTVFVTAPADSPTAQRQRVSGRILFETSVAVPSRSIAVGEVIGAGDLTTVTLPRNRLAADAITDAQSLIGKAAKHILRAGDPLRGGDIQDPLLVHKGDLVTIELNTSSLQLTAQGKALDDGAMGAAIHIANTRSNRVIDAVVAGPDRVTIGNNLDLASRS